MGHTHTPMYCFLHCLRCHLLLLMFRDLALWGNVRDVSNVCICISCHWGHCHEKALDNSHDKQKYFGNPQSLDAAEEEPSKQGAEEDPVLSVENSGRGSDALRLESKLIWPELCFCGKINSQTSGFHSSLLSRVCFLLVTLPESGEWLQMTGKRSSHLSSFSVPLLLEQTWFMHVPLSSQCSVCAVSHCWEEHLQLLASFALDPGLSSDALPLSSLTLSCVSSTPVSWPCSSSCPCSVLPSVVQIPMSTPVTPRLCLA